MANSDYSNVNPIIPGSTYRVHDMNRPQPPVVAPRPVPSDAQVLFDGRSCAGWVSANDGSPAGWKVEDGVLHVVPGTGDIQTLLTHGDIQLHIEWASPEVVKGEGQGRGNSGVFLQGLYEVQVLDCYENPTYPDGTTGGIYGQCPPLVNACAAPGEWNFFDIVFVAPRWTGEQLESPAFLTVFLNGVLLHHHQPLQGPTQHKTTASYEPKPAPVGPLKLQDHRDLVRFRNIWWRQIKGYDNAD